MTTAVVTTPDTRTGTSTARTGLAGLAPGRWAVDPARSRLVFDTRVCGRIAVRGRFTDLAGHLDVATDPLASRIRIAVATASLTSGSRTLDALLDASGLVDPTAGPAISYRSSELHLPSGTSAWRVGGTVSTTRGDRPLALELADPPAVRGGRLRLHARGEVTRADIDALLARPGAARLFGAIARLDLQVELVAPEAR